MAYQKKPKRVIPVFHGVPACSTANQYDEWQALARACPPRKGGFCQDCTPEYQREMINCNKCSYSQVVFVDDKKEGLIGVMPEYGELPA